MAADSAFRHSGYGLTFFRGLHRAFNVGSRTNGSEGLQAALFQTNADFGHGPFMVSRDPQTTPVQGPDIGLMWLMEACSLRRTKIRGTNDTKFLSNASVWPLRSPASLHQAWDLMVSNPGSAFFDQQKRLICQSVRPTDGVGCSLFATGIAARIGENAVPSVALLDRHVRSLVDDLEEIYLMARTPQARRKAVLAGFATLLLWLGWLRSSETFDACWSDFDVVEPEDGPTMDSPRGCGVVSVRLGPETKSSRNKPVDMSVAYQTLSGYHIGK